MWMRVLVAVSALATEAIWGVNQQVGDLSVSPISVKPFQKKRKFKETKAAFYPSLKWEELRFLLERL